MRDHVGNGLTGSFLGTSPQNLVEKVLGEVQGFAQPSPTCLSPCLGLEETLVVPYALTIIHKGLSLPSWAIWKPQIVMGTPESLSLSSL